MNPYLKLDKISFLFNGISDFLKPFFPFLKMHLKQADMDISERDYLSLSLMKSLFFILFFNVFAGLLLFFFKVNFNFLIVFLLPLIFGAFIFVQRLAYPKLIVNRKVKNIEQNLMPALNNMRIQLNSGVPIFDALANISREDYGVLSKEFKKAIARINAGEADVVVLEDMATNNPSLFFRRALWQIVNGMKTGSNVSGIMGNIIKDLGDEQLIQIQKYGSQLNPLAMFYMLLAVIVPALAITSMTIISSFVAMSIITTKILFWTFFFFIVFFQIIFLGMIKSRRPNLLS